MKHSPSAAKAQVGLVSDQEGFELMQLEADPGDGGMMRKGGGAPHLQGREEGLCGCWLASVLRLRGGPGGPGGFLSPFPLCLLPSEGWSEGRCGQEAGHGGMRCECECECGGACLLAARGIILHSCFGVC